MWEGIVSKDAVVHVVDPFDRCHSFGAKALALGLLIRHFSVGFQFSWNRNVEAVRQPVETLAPGFVAHGNIEAVSATGLE